MRLYIKNMKCSRCRFLVKSELEKLGLRDFSIQTGEVDIREHFPDEQKIKLRDILKGLDLEMSEEKDAILAEKIRSMIDAIVHDREATDNRNVSSLLSEKLGYNYNYLSNKFSEVAKITIKHYFIKQRIFLVKEMLVHNDYSLSQIAFMMNYSSVAHLSAQFKKETGLTPSQFRIQNSKYQNVP